MIKFKIKGLNNDIDLELESFSMVDEVESYNIDTGDACILFDLLLLDGSKRLLGVDINIKNLNKIQIEAKAVIALEKEFKI